MSALRDALAGLPDAVYADLLESDGEYLFVVDLPGVTRDTVDVRVDDGRLSVEARREKDTPEGFRYVSEDRSLFLDAELPLPPDAGDEGEASMDAGVLEVRVPKRASATEIPIEDGDDGDDGNGET
jgi:HSP20 family molecular chaperone IbpA